MKRIYTLCFALMLALTAMAQPGRGMVLPRQQPQPQQTIDPELQKLALRYIGKLAATGKIFEVNTGAIGKEYRSTPYPAPFILKRLLELKAPIILSSDSHSVKTIDCHFDETEKMLREIGFREQMQLTEKGFVSVPL